MNAYAVLADAQSDRTQELVTTTVFALVALAPVVLVAVLEFLDRDVARWESSTAVTIGKLRLFLLAYVVAVGAAIISSVCAFWYLLASFADQTAFLWVLIPAAVALGAMLLVSGARIRGSYYRIKTAIDSGTLANQPVHLVKIEDNPPALVKVSNLPAQQVVTTSTTVATASLIAGTFLAVGGLILAAGRFTPPRR